MGNPTIYWYPDPAGSLDTIDFGEGVSDLQETPIADVADARAGGVNFRSHLDSSYRVRIILERFGSVGMSALERKLQSLQSHLDKGGLVGFSRDHAKTYASIANTPSRGDTILYCSSGNGFTSWSSAGDVADQDEVVCESAWPEAQREFHLADAGGGTPRTQVILDGTTVLYTYGGNPLVRWRDFYPVLHLPDDQVGKPIVSHDHRRNFTLDITLEYSLVASLNLWQANQPAEIQGRGATSMTVLRGTTGTNGLTLDTSALDHGSKVGSYTPYSTRWVR